MRVAITHTDFRIYWPSRISALQRALESSGDELYIIEIAGKGSPYAFSENGQSLTGEIRNWICLFPLTRMEDLSPAKASLKLFSILNELSPDVVMAGSIAYPSGATAVNWAKTTDRSVIIFDDARPQDVPRNSLINYIKQLIYEQVDAILCPALPWTDTFLRWKFRPEQLFFGVDVVDNNFWAHQDPAEPDETLTIQEVIGGEIPELSVPYLLAVGRQIPVKNFLFLLRVYEKYQTATGAQHCLPLILIGDGPERKSLEIFMQEKQLEKVYLVPFVSPKKLRIFYHKAAALVVPSKSETWGLVINEAMASGIPVLASHTCGCSPVLIQEGINGYTFSPDSPDELLEVLLSFTGKNPAEKKAMGQSSQNLIRSWGLDRFVQGSLQAITYAMANKKTCRSVPAWIVLKNWKGRYRPV
ncbi:glycosyltransferase family 4 protein [Flavitalea flava]